MVELRDITKKELIMDILYRPGTARDLEKICALVQQSILQMTRHSIDQWDAFYPTQEIFCQDIEKEQLFIGEVHGEPAVIYTLNQECDAAYEQGTWTHPQVPFFVLHRLCVKPAFQNQGLGKSTLRHIEEEVIRMGKNAIRLDVFSQNPYAQRLYKNCGFQPVGSIHWRKGEFYLMEKYLF